MRLDVLHLQRRVRARRALADDVIAAMQLHVILVLDRAVVGAVLLLDVRAQARIVLLVVRARLAPEVLRLQLVDALVHDLDARFRFERRREGRRQLVVHLLAAGRRMR